MINSNLVDLEASKKDIAVVRHRGVLMTTTIVVDSSAVIPADEDILLMPIQFTSAIKSINVLAVGDNTDKALLSFGIISKDKKVFISSYGTIVKPLEKEKPEDKYEWETQFIVLAPDVTLYQQMCTPMLVEGKQRYVETPAFAPYRGDNFGYLAMKSSAATDITRTYTVRVDYVEQASQARNVEQI